ncbi:MAG: hypothetical protein AAFU64_18680, partial [Bacteroidota bacterium]
QWGAADGNRVSQAVNAGRWSSADDFVAGATPYNYIGGANDIGAEFWEANGVGIAVLRIVSIDPITEKAIVKNLGTAAENVSGYWFCLGPGAYNQLSDYSNITGDLNLDPGEEVTFDLTSGGGNVTDLPNANGGLGLFANASFGSSSSEVVLDYVQWGAGNQNRVGQAVTAGRWPNASDFVGGTAPYNFSGGAEDIGSTFWTATSSLQLCPNPSPGNLNIQGNSNEAFEVRDQQGKLIQSGSLIGGKMEIQLPQGTYFIITAGETKRAVIK